MAISKISNEDVPSAVLFGSVETDSVSCLSSCKEEHCVSPHLKLLLRITSGVLGSLHKAAKSFVAAGGCTGQIT